MANKKISQLTTKPSLAGSDLILVGDPTTGTLYKKLVSDLSSVITGSIGGSGTGGFGAKFSNDTTITASSFIYENTTGVMIGSTSPLYKFGVATKTGVNAGFSYVSFLGTDNAIALNSVNNSLATIPMVFNGSGWGWYNGGSLKMQLLDNGHLLIGQSADSTYNVDVLGTIRATTDVIITSDRRAKESITPITGALRKVLDLQGVYFVKKDSEEKRRQMGFIAQDTEGVVPEVVYKDENENYGLAIQNLTALHNEAIKELYTLVLNK